MFKHCKIWFILAGAFIISGIIICTAILAVNGFDFSSLNTEPGRTKNEYKIHRENAVNLTIETSDSDIILKKSEENGIKVTCYESDEIKYDINDSEEGKNIKIKEKDSRKWYQMININFSATATENPLTVEIPDKVWEKIEIKSLSGDVNISGFSSGDFSIETSSGDVDTLDMNAENINIESSSGDIRLNNISVKDDIVTETLSGDTRIAKVFSRDIEINSISGDVNLYKLYAINSSIETSSGDVLGNIIEHSGTVAFEVKSSSGDISVPLSYENGERIFSVNTKSGDIKIGYSE